MMYSFYWQPTDSEACYSYINPFDVAIFLLILDGCHLTLRKQELNDLMYHVLLRDNIRGYLL